MTTIIKREVTFSWTVMEPYFSPTAAKIHPIGLQLSGCLKRLIESKITPFEPNNKCRTEDLVASYDRSATRNQQAAVLLLLH